MSPVVIDAAKKRQYQIIIVIALAASFGLGFFAGYSSNLVPKPRSYDELKSSIIGEPSASSDDKVPSATDEDQKTDATKTDSTDDKDQNAEKKTKKSEPSVSTSKNTKKTSTEKKQAKASPPAPPVKKSPPPVSARPKVAKVEPKPKMESKPKPETKPVAVKVATPVAKPVLKKQAESTVLPVKMDKPAIPVSIPAAQSVSMIGIDGVKSGIDSGGVAKQTLPVGPPVTGNEAPENDAGSAADAVPSKVFAVQVGLFANRDNAQKLVYDLVDGGYDAYMDEFVSSSGDTKYNVRFGRFADRPSVQRRLQEYQQQYATPAYIIITQ